MFLKKGVPLEYVHQEVDPHCRDTRKGAVTFFLRSSHLFLCARRAVAMGWREGVPSQLNLGMQLCCYVMLAVQNRFANL